VKFEIQELVCGVGYTTADASNEWTPIIWSIGKKRHRCAEESDKSRPARPTFLMMSCEIASALIGMQNEGC